MPRNCTTDPVTQCIDCPAIPPTPGTPSYIASTPVAGWNAGANSIRSLAGDLYTRFRAQFAGAVLVGLKPNRAWQFSPELVPFGLLFQYVAGQRYARVVEFGVPRTTAQPYDSDDDFEIRRRRGQVTYLRHRPGSTQQLHASSMSSGGVLLVNACLYLSGDTVE